MNYILEHSNPVSLKTLLLDKGVAPESPHIDLSYFHGERYPIIPFVKEIGRNRVRNDFFRVHLDSRASDFLSRHQISHAPFFKSLREMAYCVFRRVHFGVSSWMIPWENSMLLITVEGKREDTELVRIKDIDWAYQIDKEGVFFGKMVENTVPREIQKSILGKIDPARILYFSEEEKRMTKDEIEKGQHYKLFVTPVHVIEACQCWGQKVPRAVLQAMNEWLNRRPQEFLQHRREVLMRMTKATHVHLQLSWDEPEQYRLALSSPILQVFLPHLDAQDVMMWNDQFWLEVMKSWFRYAFRGRPEDLMGGRVTLKQGVKNDFGIVDFPEPPVKSVFLKIR